MSGTKTSSEAIDGSPRRPTLPVPEGVRSHGWRNDLGLHAALGRLTPVPEGWRCALPSVPDNPFGNLLVLRGSPRDHTPDAVAALFDRYFEATAAHHLCVGWDAPDAHPTHLAPFLAAGFQPIDDVALARDGLPVAHQPTVSGLTVRRLHLPDDHLGLLACELAVDAARQAPYGEEAVRRNLEWSLDVIRWGGRSVGAWYGAELDGELVATLGIVSVGGQGRLQSVGTHPDHRNRGIGQALVTGAWREAAARFALDRLVLITARGGAAERFYERLGFARIGPVIGVVRPYEG